MKERVIALGFFDGVHLGHGALLRRTVEEAARRGCTPALFTYDRPPKEVVTGIPCPLINSPEDRRDLAKRLYGIRDVLMVPFDHEMMTTSWEDFITEILVGRYHGRGIGSSRLFPTANLTVPPHVLVPSHGVYVTRAYLPGGESYAAVTNVGTRPTVNNGTDVTVEACLLDFEGDLYGRQLRLEFYQHLRHEMRFDSLDALRAQIAADAETTRRYFETAK